MCAIVDANVRDQVFGDAQSEAGKFFLDWLLKPGGGTLALGGKLRNELSDNGRNLRFMDTYRQLRLDGRVKEIPDGQVDAETSALQSRRICRSNDPHVLALARLSGARLLFANDRDLCDDFKDRRIVNNPRGKVYTTSMRSSVTRVHRSLLARADLCVR